MRFTKPQVEVWHDDGFLSCLFLVAYVMLSRVVISNDTDRGLLRNVEIEFHDVVLEACDTGLWAFSDS